MNEISIACIITALFLLIPANNAFTPSALTSPESICNATPRPAFCGAVQTDGCTFHGVARKSFHYSYYITQSVFFPLVERAFYRFWNWPASCESAEKRVISALESCEDLIQENKRILIQTYDAIKCSDKLENPSEAQGLTNSLRNVLRNHETCFDALTGAAAASADARTQTEIKLNMLTQLSIGSESYNATLVLFRLGWGQQQDQITHSAA